MASLPTVQRLTAQAWVDLRARVRTMASFTQARPAKAEDAFAFSVEDDGVRVGVGPVGFQLKEKPQSDKAELFVAVEGWIRFNDVGGRLLSDGYYSRVGYFRMKEGRLEHVYGIHHDYDPTHVAHPVYHAQMAPMLELVDAINRLFNVSFDAPDDHVTPILANVRLPTARMDPFAVFMQLFADHLVNGKSANSQLRAYKEAVAICGFFESACAGIPRLEDAFTLRSLRPHHWYVR